MVKKTQLTDKKPKIKKQSIAQLKKSSSETSLSESSQQTKERSRYHWTPLESLHYFFFQVIFYHLLPKQKSQKNEALKYMEKFIKTKTLTQYISHNQKELDYSNSYKDLILYYYGIYLNLRFLQVEQLVKEIDLYLKSIDFPQSQKEKMMRQTLFNMKEINLIEDVNFEKYGKISSLLNTKSQSIQVQKEDIFQPFPHEQVSPIINKPKPKIKDQSFNGQDKMFLEIDSQSLISYISIKDSFPQIPKLPKLPQLPQFPQLLQLPQIPQKSMREIEPWISESYSIQNYNQQYRDFFDQNVSSQIQPSNSLNRQILFRAQQSRDC